MKKHVKAASVIICAIIIIENLVPNISLRAESVSENDMFRQDENVANEYSVEENSLEKESDSEVILESVEDPNVVMEGEIWDGITLTEVEVTDRTNYIIDSASKLAWLVNQVNNGESFARRTIIITGLINLGLNNWAGINKNFEGEIQIINCEIVGLKGDSLLGNISPTNLVVDTVNITGIDCRGAILADVVNLRHSGKLIIHNSDFEGNVKPVENRTSGIIGTLRLNSGGTVDIACVNVKVDGGIATSSYSFKEPLTAGLIGKVDNNERDGNVYVTECTVDAQVSGKTTDGYTNAFAGGLFGVVSANYVYIDVCSIYGSVNAYGYKGYSGGMIGRLDCRTFLIQNCQVWTEVARNWHGASGNYFGSGGFLGGAYCSDSGNIRNCYVAGAIKGGIAFVSEKQKNEVTIENCYYDVTTTGLPHNQFVSKDFAYVDSLRDPYSKSYTSDEMKVQENYHDWDFEDVWIMGDDGYPTLRKNPCLEKPETIIPVDSKDAEEIAHAIQFRLSDYFDGIEVGKTHIEGPEIVLKEQNFKAFEMDTSVKIGEGQLKAEVSFDTENKLVKVLLGIDTSGKAGIKGTTGNRMCNKEWSDEYKEFKNLYKQMIDVNVKHSQQDNPWNKFQKLKGKMNKFQCDMLVSASMYACGYMEFSYETGKVVFSEGGLLEQASADVKFSGRIPQFPVCFWAVKIELNEKGEFIFKRIKQEIKPNFSITPSVRLTGEIGLGKKDGMIKAYVEGIVSGKLSAKIANYDPILSVDFDGKVCAIWYDILHQEEQQLFERTMQQNLYTAQGRDTSVAAEGLAQEKYINLEESSKEYDNLSIEESEESQKLAEFNQYLLRLTDTAPYSNPRLVAMSDGRMMLLYLGNDENKSHLNESTLYYSIFDGKSWTETKQVMNVPEKILGFNVCQENDRVYLVVNKANELLQESAEEYLTKGELYEIEYYEGAFSTPFCVTNPSKKIYEGGQRIFVKNDEIIVAWLENSENDTSLATGTNSLHVRKCIGTNWEEEETILVTEDSIETYTLGNFGADVACIYSTRQENSTDTISSYYSITDMKNVEKKEIESGNNFAFFAGSLYYLIDGNLMVYNADEKPVVFCENITNYELLDLNGELTVMTEVATEQGFELYQINKENDGVNKALRFTNQNGYIRDYDCIEWNGSIVTVLNRIEMTDNSSFLANGKPSIIVTGENKQYDVGIDYVYYNEKEFSLGKSCPMEVKLTNYGKNTMSEFDIKIKDNAGNILESEHVAKQLSSGASYTVGLVCNIPDTLENRTIYAEVTTELFETNLSNNKVSTTLSNIDLSFETVSIEKSINNKLLAKGAMINKGTDDSSAISIQVYKSIMGEDYIGYFESSGLKAGEKQTFEIEMDGEYIFDTRSEVRGYIFILDAKEDYDVDLSNNEVRVIIDEELVIQNEQGIKDMLAGIDQPDPKMPEKDPTEEKPDDDSDNTNVVFPPINLNGEEGGSVGQSQDKNNAPNEKKLIGKIIIDKKGYEYRFIRNKNKISLMFLGNNKKNYKTVSIPSSLKYKNKTYQVSAIANGALKNNRKLQKVIIGKNVCTIGKQAFCNCKKLKTVSIPSTVTEIGNDAFSGCSMLTKVTIPAKVKKIGSKAFYNCKKLKIVTMKTITLKSIGSKTFTGCAENLTVKVAKNKKKAYTKLLKKKIPAKAVIK